MGHSGQDATGVVVMGPFRSGTSLVSGLLACLGVDFGRPQESSPPPDRYNPLGYFQRPEIVSANVRYILSAGQSQDNPGSPEVLMRAGDRSILKTVDLSWRDRALTWGMKDPRFSATLISWIDAGCIDRHRLKVVRVGRDVGAIAASVMKHRVVRDYCGNDPAKALEMSKTYDSLATWTEQNLAIPTCTIRYEQLVGDPAREVERLAEYVGTLDPLLVRRSIRLIGRRRALFHHYLRKLTHPGLLATTIMKTLGVKAGSTAVPLGLDPR